MRREAVIDVGSNSLLLLVAEERPDGGWRMLAEALEVPRLGAGRAPDGRLQPDAIARTLAALGRLAARAAALGAATPVAVGTQALRNAPNTQEILPDAESLLGRPIEVLSAADEARLGAEAAFAGLALGATPALIADIGGGSTEVSCGSPACLLWTTSRPLGALALTARFGTAEAVSDEAVCALDAALRHATADLPVGPAAPFAFVAVGGAVTTLAALDLALASYDARRVHGHVLTRAAVQNAFERLRRLPLVARRALPGLAPERADIVVAGVAILRALMARYAAESVQISTRGLRHGVFAERFGPLEPPV